MASLAGHTQPSPNPQNPSSRLRKASSQPSMISAPAVKNLTPGTATATKGIKAAEMGKSSRTRTSESHPITVSWIHRPGEDSLDGRVGLCYCPGKNVVRDGVSWQRSCAKDLTSLRDEHGVNVIVCLLSDAELRSLGVDRNYAKIVQSHGLQLLRLPIVEMFAPDSMTPAQSLVTELLHLVKMQKTAVIHCRGGVGRAGMLGACLLLLLGEAKTSFEAISLVRKRRCKTAVESRSQETFVHRFAETLKQADAQAHGGEEEQEGGCGGGERRGVGGVVSSVNTRSSSAYSGTGSRRAAFKATVGVEGVGGTSRAVAGVRGTWRAGLERGASMPLLAKTKPAGKSIAVGSKGSMIGSEMVEVAS